MVLGGLIAGLVLLIALKIRLGGTPARDAADVMARHRGKGPL